MNRSAANDSGSCVAAHKRLPAWFDTTSGLAVLGSLLMWIAVPPCDLWLLGWIAPIPWLLLVQKKQLSGRRPYRALWLAGFLFWLLAVHWLRLPHPATHLGWLALSFYLAFYLPAFVATVRVGVHTLRVPLVIAAPVVWTGLELARAHLLSGFLMAALGHTQYRWIALIQTSDLAGGYSVSFVVMFVAACLAEIRPADGRPWRLWPAVAALVMMAAVLTYGTARIADVSPREGPTVALIQGSIEADWKSNPEKQQRIFEQYFRLSETARSEAGRLDLIVWPETMFRQPIVEIGPAEQAADDGALKNGDWLPNGRGNLGNQEQTRVPVPLFQPGTPKLIAQIARLLDTPLLLGLESRRYKRPEELERFNAAQAADRNGRLVDRYDKMHLVMFGEYVPLARLVPQLYQLTPLGGGLSAGSEPKAIDLEGVRYAPSICFETVLPHLIRRQVRTLTDAGQEPDVLVNLTNDAWFWGSSELDMHLICGVFRAVECRKPLLVAANSGISAWIDADGRIRAKCAKQQEDILIARTELDSRRSVYLSIGDWPVGLCLVATVVMAIAGWFQNRRKRYL